MDTVMYKGIVELDLYIVRHGESYGNIAETTGEAAVSEQAVREDPRLSAKGENQARLLGERFSGVKLDAVYSSALHRALSTAKAVVERQPGVGADKILVLPELTENGVALDFKGSTFDELQEEYGCLAAADGVDLTKPLVIGNRESDVDSQTERARYVFDFLHAKYNHGERVMLAAHACFNTTLLLYALGLSQTQLFDPDYVNTGVTRIIFFKKGTGYYGYDVRLCCHNDMSHLYAEYPEVLSDVH